IM
ncbi:hypothetical protein CISIN_1g0317992mg, partial [Citrus sinensis]